MEYLAKTLNKDEWELIDFDDIKKGDRIAYYRKKMKYQDGKEVDEKFIKGAWCAFNDNGKFIGLSNHGANRNFSVQKDNVLHFYKKKEKKESEQNETEKETKPKKRYYKKN